MLIDSHLHVWSRNVDPSRYPFPGQQAGESAGRDDHDLAQVNGELDAAGVTGVVLVQVVNDLGHTDELLATAAGSTRPARVVGWLPLTEPGEVTLALQRYADRPELVGIRNRLLPDDPRDLFLQPAVSQSLELIGEAGLVLDVMPWPGELLGQVPLIARRHPGLTIVIALLGGPPVAEGRMQPWTDQLAAAAAEPGVCIKMGGLYRLSGARSSPDDWRPYLSTAVELFGSERIMFGSNWPARPTSGHSYLQTVDTVLATFDELVESERADLRGATATRVYRFD